MALNFGQHPDVVYEKAPLATVMCQVKFSPILSLAVAEGVAGFQQALRKDYPNFPAPQQSASVQVGPISSVNVSPPVWRLLDADSNWTVGVAVDFVSLETPRYTSIEDFLERLDRVLNVIARTIQPSLSGRVGLRKVNIIEAPVEQDPSSFSGVIRPEFLGPLGLDNWPVPIAGAASQLHFNESDDTGLVVRSGIGRDDAGKLGFVLDMDYFTDRPFEVQGGGDLTESLRQFSDSMTSFFHWAVMPDYLNTLSPHPRQTDLKGS